MYTPEQLQDLINKEIAEKHYPLSPSELYDPIQYIMSLGGKRMRPALVLMACDLFEGSVIKALQPALGIEMFHNFTLMHDDIMDRAPLRRGRQTVHTKWNENVAILSGDVMLVEAYKLITLVDDTILRKVLDIFSETASGVCEGQQTDMNFEVSDSVTIPDYIEMIRLKTAVLLGCSLKIGALIGNADDQFSSYLYKFGENLGIAFQLQDDILDIYGDPEKFGKQVGGDIISNKKTFLLIKALEIAEGLDAEELHYWLNSEDPETEAKIKSVTDIYNRLGVRQLAEKEMSHFAEQALSHLEKINVPSERKLVLRGFADQLLIREN
ncbi:polyprenyl synthetase family protein [Pararcticibacter amylolyticus]|uniref:Isoprenyl synthetase n=1 Tax=Pararcticibacter amylolyticus TaxID=2173175 RepID=A0A2U2PGH2_9SPHI|nr:polyprenyl synthetase family protein [Pararcticibacter amylolyticus]PWG80424.1 isoprenyl synthetase [Pararcticibacter amylolyticus]